MLTKAVEENIGNIGEIEYKMKKASIDVEVEVKVQIPDIKFRNTWSIACNRYRIEVQQMNIDSEEIFKKRRRFSGKIKNLPPNTTDQQLEVKLLLRYAITSPTTTNPTSRMRHQGHTNETCYYNTNNNRNRAGNDSSREQVGSNITEITKITRDDQLEVDIDLMMEEIVDEMVEDSTIKHPESEIYIGREEEMKEDLEGMKGKENNQKKIIKEKRRKWDIIGLSEAKLNERNDRYKFKELDEYYTTITASHKENTKEGIALIIRNQFKKNIRNIEKLQGQLIKVELIFNNQKNKNMLIVQVYQPNNDRESRNKIKKKINEWTNRKDKDKWEIIVMGDLNENIDKLTNNKDHRKIKRTLVDQLKSKGYTDIQEAILKNDEKLEHT
ncbi:hypothetical protein C1645_833112 [Glomus cerebriforme]|uniref:Endonuclease/exonuclease/phosphatase domain-containing protein n=1 Tax=Glomus cerebriforme TaxID=658196 RepID=A0A397SC83_9GLOM|nr:hypothetical protein C1645_833112 [Glomus cerebriforme]